MAGEPFIWYGVGICAVGVGVYFAYRYLASENVSWADEEGDLDLEEDRPDLEERLAGGQERKDFFDEEE